MSVTIANLANRCLIGALAAVLSCSVVAVALAQETVDEKPAYVQLVEDLERELDEALLKNHDLETKVKNLSSALGVLAEREGETKRELEELRESHQKAVVNLELFSVALQRAGGEGMKELLIKAASDLRLVQEEKDAIAQGLVGLMNAVEGYLNASAEEAGTTEEKVAEVASTAAESWREPMREALRGGEEALGLILSADRLAEKTISEARVITVNKEFNLVLVDVGQRQGLRVGTPISLHRKDRTVGSALVIDVRDTFAGAILLDLSDPNDQIMIGDTMRVDPEGV